MCFAQVAQGLLQVPWLCTSDPRSAYVYMLRPLKFVLCVPSLSRHTYELPRGLLCAPRPFQRQAQTDPIPGHVGYLPLYGPRAAVAIIIIRRAVSLTAPHHLRRRAAGDEKHLLLLASLLRLLHHHVLELLLPVPVRLAVPVTFVCLGSQHLRVLWLLVSARLADTLLCGRRLCAGARRSFLSLHLPRRSPS